MSSTECVAGDPLSLHVVYDLLAHEGVMDCVRSDASYFEQLQLGLSSVLEVMRECGQLEHSLLAAACVVTGWDGEWEPDPLDTDDAYAGHRDVALCLERVYDVQVGAAAYRDNLLGSMWKSLTSIDCCQQLTS